MMMAPDVYKLKQKSSFLVVPWNSLIPSATQSECWRKNRKTLTKHFAPALTLAMPCPFKLLPRIEPLKGHGIVFAN